MNLGVIFTLGFTEILS